MQEKKIHGKEPDAEFTALKWFGDFYTVGPNDNENERIQKELMKTPEIHKATQKLIGSGHLENENGLLSLTNKGAELYTQKMKMALTEHEPRDSWERSAVYEAELGAQEKQRVGE